MKYVVFLCHTIKILISNWPQTRKFSHLLQAGKTVPFDFAHHGHALRPIFILWLVSLTGEFMRQMYAASWIMLTLTAEAVPYIDLHDTKKLDKYRKSTGCP